MSFDPLALRIIWNHQIPVTSGLGYRNLHVDPEPGYPFGRKGLQLMTAWETIGVPGKHLGMLILDGDVAIDPHDNRSMHAHIWDDPYSIWVAPARIWPVSHLRDGWLWGHGKDGRFTQEDVDEPDMFSFCFTYLPSELLAAMQETDAHEWCYPEVDHMTWLLAQRKGIRVRVARNCSPKHMHYM